MATAPKAPAADTGEPADVAGQRYRALFDAIDDGFCVIEVLFDENDRPHDYRFIDANRAFARHTGLHDVLGRTIRSIAPGHEERWYETYGKVARTGEPVRFVERAEALGRWYEVFAFRVEDTRLVGVLFRDIGDRIATERLLRDSEERYRTLFESIDEGFCIVELIYDADGKASDWLYVATNPAFDTHSGLHGVVGKRFREVGPSLEQFWYDLFDQVVRTGRPAHVEARAESFERPWFEVRAVRLNPPERARLGIIFSNITERKQREAALQESERRLREADQRKNEFLATLAHELRNPLAPINNSLHLLRIAGDRINVERVHEMLERQVGHMVRLVDDLMEVARITSGAIELRRVTLDLGTIVSQAIDAARPAIERAGQSVAADLPPDPLFVDGDAVRLVQVFSNLLNNAARYSDPGGRIVVRARRAGTVARVTVQDGGIGIARERLSGMFAMFSQLDPAGIRSRGGLGIGLALSQRLAQMHGGEISVDSEGLGQGSTFTVVLPLVSRLPGKPAAPAPAPPTTSHATRVLVVDDNRDAADSTGVLLTVLGADVRVAHDAAAALVLLVDWTPDIALLDLGMPGMDGYDLAQRIRERPALHDVVLIALTGWGQHADRDRSRAAGFDDHIVKPASIEALTALLRARTTAHGH